MLRNKLKFARKYRAAAAFTLLAAMTACSASGEPAGQQNVDVASGEPELSAEQSNLDSPGHELMISLPDLGPATDITNEVWLNTDNPLDLEAVRGRVVLVEFWTFG